MTSLRRQDSALPAHDDFSATKAQIIKDFGSDLHHPAIDQATDYDQLTHALHRSLDHLLRGAKPRLMQLIYRVDISEARLGRELENLNADEAAHRLAHLIVERERQKIELRRRMG